MAKPEWGSKHTCPKCGTKFYDLRRTAYQCPRCATEIEGDGEEKARASRSPPEAAAKAEPGHAAAHAEAGEKDADAESPDDDEGVTADASELGEDEDDVAEVLEGTIVKADKD